MRIVSRIVFAAWGCCVASRVERVMDRTLRRAPRFHTVYNQLANPGLYGKEPMGAADLPGDDYLGGAKTRLDKILKKNTLGASETAAATRAVLTVSNRLVAWDTGLVGMMEDVEAGRGSVSAAAEQLQGTIKTIQNWKATIGRANAVIAAVNTRDKSLVGAWIPSIDRKRSVRPERVSEDVVFRLKTEPIAQTPSSVLFEAKLTEPRRSPSSVWRALRTDRQYVIKYVNTCNYAFNHSREDLLSVYRHDDSLVDEFVLMKAVEGSGVAPRVHSLSVPLMVENVDWWDTNPKLRSDGTSRRVCGPHNGKLFVRAIVEEKVGVTLEKFFLAGQRELVQTGDMDQLLTRMRLAIRAGIRVLELLIALHGQGFLHNDIHGGNFAFRSPEAAVDGDELPKMVLIDFGFASFYPAEMGSEDGSSSEGLNLTMLSPWQLQQLRRGRRDDVFRAVETVADFLTRIFKNSLFQLQQRLEKIGLEKLVELKRVGDLFSGPIYGGFNICGLYFRGDPSAMRICTRGMVHMQLALQEARACATADTEPHYEAIIHHMETAIEELRPAIP